MRTAAIAFLALSALLAAAGSTAEAGYIINGVEYAYAAGSSTEFLFAEFDAPDGGVTAELYSGYVLVSVFGTGNLGNNDPDLDHDAFYAYAGAYAGAPDSTLAQMTFDTKTLVENDKSKEISNVLVYDAETGSQVSSPYTPAYRTDHHYFFIIDAGSVASHLHFGIYDSFYGDNTGSYSVSTAQLTAVSAPTVPEPASLAMLGLGAGVLGCLVRRKARIAA